MVCIAVSVVLGDAIFKQSLKYETKFTMYLFNDKYCNPNVDFC